MAPSNLGTINALTVASFGLIAGYVIQGILNGESLAQIILILLIVGVAFAPTVIPVMQTGKN
jgi:hypothetical protein